MHQQFLFFLSIYYLYKLFTSLRIASFGSIMIDSLLSVALIYYHCIIIRIFISLMSQNHKHKEQRYWRLCGSSGCRAWPWFAAHFSSDTSTWWTLVTAMRHTRVLEVHVSLCNKSWLSDCFCGKVQKKKKENCSK